MSPAASRAPLLRALARDVLQVSGADKPMSFMTGISHIHEALDYHLARHNLLTANLAHVDTPGYRPRELRRVTSFDTVLEARLAVTDPRHLGTTPRPPGWQVDVDRFSPVGPDGNGVSLDREAVKIASNNLRYDALAQLVHGALYNLQFAAQDGR